MTDPIADLLTRIRNAGNRNIEEIEIPHSKMKEQIVKILADNKFIDSFEVVTDEQTGFKNLEVALRYVNNEFAIHNLTRVSKPGIRRYIRHHQIRPVLGGVGIAILSTSKGIMTDAQAREQKIGGELLCTIY